MLTATRKCLRRLGHLRRHAAKRGAPDRPVKGGARSPNRRRRCGPRQDSWAPARWSRGSPAPWSRGDPIVCEASAVWRQSDEGGSTRRSRGKHPSRADRGGVMSTVSTWPRRRIAALRRLGNDAGLAAFGVQIQAFHGGGFHAPPMLRCIAVSAPRRNRGGETAGG